MKSLFCIFARNSYCKVNKWIKNEQQIDYLDTYEVDVPNGCINVQIISDEQKISFGIRTGIVHLYDLKTRKLTDLILGSKSNTSLLCMSFSLNGQIASMFGMDKTLCIMNRNTNQTVHVKKENYIHSLCFSPDNNKIIATTINKTIEILDTNNGDLINCITDFSSNVNYICYSPDGNHFAYAISGNIIQIMNEEIEAVIWEQNMECDITSLCFSPNGREIIVGLKNNKIAIWDIQNVKKVTEFDTDHIFDVTTSIQKK